MASRPAAPEQLPGCGTPGPRTARRILLPAAAPARRSSPRSGPGRSSLHTAAAPPTVAGRSASGRTARGRSRPAGCSSTGFPPCRSAGLMSSRAQRRMNTEKQQQALLGIFVQEDYEAVATAAGKTRCGEATTQPRPPPSEASATARGEARLRPSFLRRPRVRLDLRGGQKKQSRKR